MEKTTYVVVLGRRGLISTSKVTKLDPKSVDHSPQKSLRFRSEELPLELTKTLSNEGLSRRVGECSLRTSKHEPSL